MNKYLASLLATFSLSLAELSTAQSITIGPASTEIPTTGAPVLITLAALLAYLAYRFKDHSGARKLGVFLLLGAGLSALGGIKLLQQATAGGGANLDLKTIADSYYYHS
ncbi:MAG: hypothetical protein OIF38_08350, partial [Cellvibrionaceae bacterium]|nr:hypothetical protein [Cellvibrionaceae bacterium]